MPLKIPAAIRRRLVSAILGDAYPARVVLEDAGVCWYVECDSNALKVVGRLGQYPTTGDVTRATRYLITDLDPADSETIREAWRLRGIMRRRRIVASTMVAEA